MDRINKILNIRPNEWRRLLFIFAILIFANVGTTWATSATYGTFTQVVGDKSIIWVQLSSAILSVLFMFVYTAFVDRVDNNRLFAYIIALGGGLKLVSLILTAYFPVAWVFLGLHILSEVWLAAWGAQFATYVNDLFDLQSAKRTWPIVLAAASIGGIVGGFSLKFLTDYAHFDAVTIVQIWLATDVVTFGVLWVMPLFIKEHKKIAREQPKTAKKDEASFTQGMKDGLNFTLQSNLLRWMAIGTLVLMALMSLMEYYSNSVLSPRPDYIGLLGILKGISGVVGLVILFFGVGWMTRSWGVKNTSLAFPVLSLLMGAGIAAFGATSYLVASLAFITRKGLRSGFQGPIEALFFNAVPLRIKGRARAFVGGMVTPIGTMIGVFLLWLLFESKFIPEPAFWLRNIIVLLSLIYLVGMFITRHQYTQALVKMLEEEDYSFLLSEEASSLTVADPATLTRLQKTLDESHTHEMRVFMTQLIAQVGGAESLSILEPAIHFAAESRTRAAMLDVISAAGLRGAKIQELYTKFLSDPDAQVRQAAASGLEQILGASDSWLQTQWVKMLNDPDAQVFLYALQSLAASGNFYQFETAVQKLEQLLASPAAEDKKNALDMLSVIAQPKSAEQMLPFLQDANQQVRLEAILGLEKMPLPFNHAVDENIFHAVQPLLKDSLARARQAALQVAGKFKRKETFDLLVAALADGNPLVCYKAADFIVRMGKDAVTRIQAELNAEDLQTRKMASVILSRINPRQFGSLIDKSVSENLSRIYQNIGLEQAFAPYKQYHSVRVQLVALREENDSLIDEILYFLSAIHDPQVLEVIGVSLHSESSATRNLALEALESLTSPQIAALIASLFEPSLAPLQLMQLGQGTLNIEQPTVVQALEKNLLQTDSEFDTLLSVLVTRDILSAIRAEKDSMGEPLPRLDVTLAPNLLPALEKLSNHPNPRVKDAANFALQLASGTAPAAEGEAPRALSVIEKMSILKDVPFFRNIPIAQLESLAVECEEKTYPKNTRLFKAGDTGSALYVVVDGEVSIEQEKRGVSTPIATLGNNSYFGEMAIFENNVRSASAVVKKDNSLVMELSRSPIFSLTMASPDLALELINVLSQRIRETSDRLADSARARPRELHKLFDQFG